MLAALSPTLFPGGRPHNLSKLTMKRLCRIIGLAAAAASLCPASSSCSLMKASPAKPSPFAERPSAMRPEPKHSPFQRNWTSTELVAKTTAKKPTPLYVAPVTLKHLRPMTRSISVVENSEASRQEAAKELAGYAREKFITAFKKSPKPCFEIAEKAVKGSVTLELALVELNPNSLSGGVLRTAINVVALPGIDSVIARPLKGNIAIEGKLTDSKTKKVLFEFADNRESKSALVFSVYDFLTYGQAREAIREWAVEFEKLMRTPASERVRGSSGFTILPW